MHITQLLVCNKVFCSKGCRVVYDLQTDLQFSEIKYTKITECYTDIAI